MDEADLRRADARVAAVLRSVCRGHDDADFTEGELVRRWAGSAWQAINRVLVSPSPADGEAVRRSLWIAADYMRSRPEPGIAVVGRARLQALSADELAEAARASGLRFGAVWMEMAGEASAIAGRGTPPVGLRFSRLSGEAGVRILADINSKAYGLPLEAGRDGILRACSLWTESYSFAAYREGEPLSVCSYLVQDGRLYLSWVATHPDARRRGYASALISHVLHEASSATGIEATDLHATEAGAPVYERLGYRRSVPFQLFLLAD